MKNYLAQVEYPLPSPIRGLGPFGLEHDTSADVAPGRLTTFISNTIGLLTLIAGIWFFFTLISGAISWIGAGGNSAKIEEAQKRITMGLVGMIIVIAAIFIAQILGDLVGFPAITDPASILRNLGP